MAESALDLPLVDANVFLRFVLNDVPEQSSRAIELFAQLELGLGRVQTTDTVVFESVFVLQSFYEVPRDAIRQALLPLLQQDNLVLLHRSLYSAFFGLYLTHRKLSFADCFHAILARDFGAGEIISFDRGFDRIPGVTRRDPLLKLDPR